MTDIEILKKFARQQNELNESTFQFIKEVNKKVEIITDFMDNIVELLSQETKQQEE